MSDSAAALATVATADTGRRPAARASASAANTNTTTPAAGRPLGLALAVISAAQLMIVLDVTIVNVALPTIHTSLHFATSQLQWLLTAYSLTFGGLLLLGGRAGDLFGRRRMFLTGVALFATASLLGGLATDEAWLIATRALQGVGAAIAAPAALSLIATTFPEGRDRNRALGVYAAMSGGGSAVGLLLGGVLTDLVSWRWVFFINVPIAAAVLLLAPRALKESATTPGRLDLPGAATVTGAMLSLVYGLSNTASHGWTALSTVVPIAAAAGLFAAFLTIEARSSRPLMPLHIFAERNRSGSYAMALFLGTALLSTFFFLTQFLQNVLRWSPLKTGVGFLPMTVGVIAAAAVTSRLVDRVGVRIPLLFGPVALLAGMTWLSRLTVTSGYLDVIGPLLIIAVGIGSEFVPLTATAVRGVPRNQTGVAAALVNTAQQIGGALGLSVLATVAATSANDRARALTTAAHGHPSALTGIIATTHGYATAFEVSAGIAALGLIVALTVIRTPHPEPGADSAPAAGIDKTSIAVA
jgi:EmrB/QacA subfamily drug resistance transporter